jgi:hypothetical protein
MPTLGKALRFQQGSGLFAWAAGGVSFMLPRLTRGKPAHGLENGEG